MAADPLAIEGGHAMARAAAGEAEAKKIFATVRKGGVQETWCYRHGKDYERAERNWDKVDLKAGITPWFTGRYCCTVETP